MIVKDFLNNNMVFIENYNTKEYYSKIIKTKYNKDINNSNKDQSKIIKDKIKQIYGKK